MLGLVSFGYKLIVWLVIFEVVEVCDWLFSIVYYLVVNR